MDDIPNIVTNPIFNGLHKLLQVMGAAVRWLCFVGDRNLNYLMLQKELNAFIGVFVLACGAGLFII
ncbi:hypothetical protein AMR72_05670 [Flavobacterium psychrophilum]|nr:hypothetical protein AMR72_05670 [Flavobacterium psychrophilum]AOE52051.1 hypothetical protein ALW18_05665 [Flavobacterium psychrophilum]